MNGILSEYVDKFGHLPGIPMMQCSGLDDEKYIAMCAKAVKRGTPVCEDDYDEFFPVDGDVLY